MAKKKRTATPDPILAAGGIVTRGRTKPVFAIVRLRRQKSWVLPKGKLHRNETTIDAAKREAIEETGHDMMVHEFLGSLAYVTSGRPKIVKFWRMEASRKPISKLMRDVSAVRWLPLDMAIKKLTHERERDFLIKVGPHARSRLQNTAVVRMKPRPTPPIIAKDTDRRRPSHPSPASRSPVRLADARPRDLMQSLWRWLGRS